MEITLRYFEDCPNWTVTHERLTELAAERPGIRVTRQVVATPEEAERLGFHGSPSVLIDGVDAFAPEGAGVGMSCRRYDTPDGPSGSPTLAQLRAVTADA